MAAGEYHTVGLKSDGTVVAAGWNQFGQCNVGNWAGIVKVAAGYYHTVGLKSNGTVVAVGNNSYDQLNVGSWSSIVQVASGRLFTIGLKSDGTVVAVGDDSEGQRNVGSWTGIAKISTGNYYTVGLKFDGTVVAVGESDEDQLNVSGWNLGMPCPIENLFGEESEETEIFRSFRDNLLSMTSEGQEIIRLYYEWSPTIVKLMEEDEEFKAQLKEMIDVVLPLVRELVE